MNNFNWEEFKNGGVAIWCNTEDLAKDFITKCYERNMKWKNYGSNMEWIEITEFEKNKTTFYYEYEDNTCYIFDNVQGRLLYTRVGYCKNSNYKIIEWVKDDFQTLFDKNVTKLMLNSLYGKGKNIVNEISNIETNVIKEIILDYNVDKITLTKQGNKVLIKIKGNSHYYEGELSIDGTLVYTFNN